MEFQFSRPEDSPGYLLWQLTMLWQRKIKKELDKLGLTHTQFVLMAAIAWLSKTNKQVMQVDVAEQSNTDRMMVSKVLRTLEQKAYVQRQAHETDTRAKTLLLTEKGELLFEKAIQVVEQVDFEFFSVLQTHQEDFKSNMLTLITKNP